MDDGTESGQPRVQPYMTISNLLASPAYRALDFPHHSKVNVSQLAVLHLEEVAGVGVTVVVPLLQHLLQATPTLKAITLCGE